MPSKKEGKHKKTKLIIIMQEIKLKLNLTLYSYMTFCPERVARLLKSFQKVSPKSNPKISRISHSSTVNFTTAVFAEFLLHNILTKIESAKEKDKKRFDSLEGEYVVDCVFEERDALKLFGINYKKLKTAKDKRERIDWIKKIFDVISKLKAPDGDDYLVEISYKKRGMKGSEINFRIKDTFFAFMLDLNQETMTESGKKQKNYEIKIGYESVIGKEDYGSFFDTLFRLRRNCRDFAACLFMVFENSRYLLREGIDKRLKNEDKEDWLVKVSGFFDIELKDAISKLFEEKKKYKGDPLKRLLEIWQEYQLNDRFFKGYTCYDFKYGAETALSDDFNLTKVWIYAIYNLFYSDSKTMTAYKQYIQHCPEKMSTAKKIIREREAKKRKNQRQNKNGEEDSPAEEIAA